MTDPSELSLQDVHGDVTRHKQNGTLGEYLFHAVYQKRFGRLLINPTPRPTIWTPLHAACFDRDGHRGEAKIALLLYAAREDGVAVDRLAKESRSPRSPRSSYHYIMDKPRTPFEILAKNPLATDRALELIFGAWPGALVDTPATKDMNPLQLAINTAEPTDQRLSSKVATLLRLAERTTNGISSLLMHRSSPSGFSALHEAVGGLRPESMDNALNVVEQLLQACLASGVITDYRGNIILHLAQSFKNDAIICRIVQCIVENTPKTYLAAMLSTEDERIPRRRVPRRYGEPQARNTYEATPVCHVERNGLVQTREVLINLARETDTHGRTLLHYTAANILCDGDPQEKQKREKDRVTRRMASSYDVPVQLPPEGPRQGTKKLVDWLLQVHPEASSQRDSSGRLPLHFAVATGKVWNNGIKSLTQGYPEAVAVQDPTSGFFPFMTAATQPQVGLDTVYNLLRFNPSVVDSLSSAPLWE